MDVRPLGSVPLNRICPMCGRAYIGRGCETDDQITTLNGLALYSVFETCMIPACSWMQVTDNVKIGV
jgi:hypothetical protein